LLLARPDLCPRPTQRRGDVRVSVTLCARRQSRGPWAAERASRRSGAVCVEDGREPREGGTTDRHKCDLSAAAEVVSEGVGSRPGRSRCEGCEGGAESALVTASILGHIDRYRGQRGHTHLPSPHSLRGKLPCLLVPPRRSLDAVPCVRGRWGCWLWLLLAGVSGLDHRRTT